MTFRLSGSHINVSEDVHASKPSTDVAVVILNWRAADMTLRTVRHVFDQSLQPRHVFVVENGSGDDSAMTLARGLAEFGDRATLIVNERNLGFGGGCNRALRKGGREFSYYWLLNNDAEPESTCLACLVRVADQTPSVGAVGSLMTNPDHPESDHYGSRLHPFLLFSSALQAPEDIARHRLAWLTAASLLVSEAALQQVGLFDERFFMYWEDADLNMRMREAGFAVVGAPGARVKHIAGTSSTGMATRRYLWHFASQRLWLRKHHPLGAIMLPLLRAKYLLKAAVDRDIDRLKALLNA